MSKKLSEKVEELLAIAKARIKFKEKLYSLMEKFADDKANRNKYLKEVITLFEEDEPEASEAVEGEIVDDAPF